MTKAGEKMIRGAKEALKVARCRHQWERLETKVLGGKVVRTLDVCRKCRCRRTMY